MLHGSLSRLIPRLAEATVDVVMDNAKPHAKPTSAPIEETAHLSDDDSSILPEDACVEAQSCLSPTSPTAQSLVSSRPEPTHRSLPDMRKQIQLSLSERRHSSDSALSLHSDDTEKWEAPSSPSSLMNASKPVRRSSMGSNNSYDAESSNMNL